MNVLSASAIPALNSFTPRLLNTSTHIYTHRGWVIVPNMFLYDSKFTPFLPPIEASTCARRVVGTNAKFTPLLYIEATNPAISVVIPPPTPRMNAPLSAPESRSFSAIEATVSRFLFCSQVQISMRLYPSK